MTARASEMDDPFVRRVTLGFRITVALVGVATWLLIPLQSLRTNLQLDARGQLTSGDSTGYLIMTFIVGLAFGAVVLSAYIGFMLLIRDPGVVYATGFAMLAVTALWVGFWLTSDDALAGFALVWLLPSGWAAVIVGIVFQSKRAQM